MGMKGPKAKPMAALFKMQPKSEPMAALMKKIGEEQEGLQKLAKSEKGKEAVKKMGYTQDVDGAMLMKKDYAMMMGGYGKKMPPMRAMEDKKPTDAPFKAMYGYGKKKK